MAKRQLNLISAIKDGVITQISEVPSGLKCGCICPACGAQLVAKKGSKMVHHFAHHAGQNCEYGYESSLHLAAKAILSKAKKMMIPAVYVSFPNSNKNDELISDAKEIAIDSVELEKRFGDVIPDIVIHSGGKQFFVEIFVTHRIDESKLKKLQSANISTIEIDLSRKDTTITAEELTGILLNDSGEKTWKYNVIANKYLQRFYQISDQKELTSRGFALQVDDCPIKSRTWKGKHYANFIDDCLCCKYCISTAYNGFILCSGRARVSTIGDFGIPECERVKNGDIEIDTEKTDRLLNGICPNCGSSLVERQSKHGTFWGCRSYPHCRFTISVDSKTGEILTKP